MEDLNRPTEAGILEFAPIVSPIGPDEAPARIVYRTYKNSSGAPVTLTLDEFNKVVAYFGHLREREARQARQSPMDALKPVKPVLNNGAVVGCAP